jgi:hypothetical protein
MVEHVARMSKMRRVGRFGLEDLNERVHLRDLSVDRSLRIPSGF